MLSDGWHSYIHKYKSNASMLSRVIFYLKIVNFLFLFSIEKCPISKHEEDYLFKIPVAYKSHEDTKHIYTKWRKWQCYGN